MNTVNLQTGKGCSFFYHKMASFTHWGFVNEWRLNYTTECDTFKSSGINYVTQWFDRLVTNTVITQHNNKHNMGRDSYVKPFCSFLWLIADCSWTLPGSLVSLQFQQSQNKKNIMKRHQPSVSILRAVWIIKKELVSTFTLHCETSAEQNSLQQQAVITGNLHNEFTYCLLLVLVSLYTTWNVA